MKHFTFSFPTKSCNPVCILYSQRILQAHVAPMWDSGRSRECEPIYTPYKVHRGSAAHIVAPSLFSSHVASGCKIQVCRTF